MGVARLLGVLSLVACGTLPARPEPPGPAVLRPRDFFERELPPLGSITLVRVRGEPASRRLLAASLQGVVNTSRVRLYVVDEDEAAERFWLQRYGVEVAGETDLDGALAAFGREAAGYVLASESEPWTIGAATTLAGLDRLLVAVPADAGRLDALELVRRQDLRGRWASNEECIRDTFATLYPRTARSAIAAIAPGESRVRDFAIQNRLFVFHARPFTEGWSAVADVLTQTPGDQPVFGYLSANGLEEGVSVGAISRSGKFLIPTDTTPNLSVHAAIRAPVSAAAPSAPPGCGEGAMRVVVAMSDGDNLALPLQRYVSDRYWLAPERRARPMGWSISPALVHLAPAAAAYYGETRTAESELVSMIGIGYASPSFLPDPERFLDRTFAAVGRLGTEVLWEIELGLYDPGASLWRPLAERCKARRQAGVLLGYFLDPVFGSGASFRTHGVQVLVSRSDYADGPAEIAARIDAARSAWKAGGPDHVFLSAAAWNNDFAGLAQVLAALPPDVTPMTPSALLRCLGPP